VAFAMNQFDFELNAGIASQRAWPPSRAEGLTRIEAFAGRMGSHYATRRNHDLGPDDRANVSLLSPYLRRRLVTEAEVVQAALDRHTLRGSEKFVQEVFWRSYWKGWLEARPSVWTGYRVGLEADLARLADTRALRRAVGEAEEGATGIACFDAWAHELVDTGYLHNHARMWFASIWIFSLGLPWRLGADFFLRHLLDGDPASNTLSWRWVAGLHTRGKHYVAIAANIARYTGGRFVPAPRTLNEAAQPLVEDTPPSLPAPIRAADRADPARPMALLITEEDCCPEDFGLDLRALKGAATLQITPSRSPRPVSDAVAAFDRGALDDAAQRLESGGAPVVERLVGVGPADLARWAARNHAAQVVTPWAPVGPVRDLLDAARPALRAAGAELVMLRRPFDDMVWPHATAGFFKLKDKIPRLVERLR
jgi:deoxyribodipyrimidine photo-lyase